MTAKRLKESAAALFAAKGYAGTSLDQIAKEVGIKKQSIYTHFESKEALFLAIFKESVETEIIGVTVYFDAMKQASLANLLHGLIVKLKQRYDTVLSLRLILTFSFMLPEGLPDNKAVIGDLIQAFINTKLKHVHDRFQAASSHLPDVTPDEATYAYMNLLEGMLVGMIYNDSPDHFARRLDAAWKVFWRGIGYS